MNEILFAVTDEDYLSASNLFKEYAAGLDIDLGFQYFEKELQTLPVMYARPYGCILLYQQEQKAVACVAIRRYDRETAELKRMFVQPAFRGMGIARQLLDRAVLFAREAGYNSMVLDTLNTMQPAMQLYLKNGFLEIPAYYHNPEKTAVYFRKTL